MNGAHGTSPVAPRTGLEDLTVKASRTLGTDRHAVRGLVAQISTGNGFAVSDQIVERLLQAELGFRSGTRHGFTKSLLSARFNHLVDVLGGTSFLYTNENQVSMLMELLSDVVPDLLYPLANGSVGAVVSPAG